MTAEQEKKIRTQILKTLDQYNQDRNTDELGIYATAVVCTVDGHFYQTCARFAGNGPAPSDDGEEPPRRIRRTESVFGRQRLSGGAFVVGAHLGPVPTPPSWSNSVTRGLTPMSTPTMRSSALCVATWRPPIVR